MRTFGLPRRLLEWFVRRDPPRAARSSPGMEPTVTWRTYLATALQRATGDAGIDHLNAESRIERIGDAELLRVDQHLRAVQYTYGGWLQTIPVGRIATGKPAPIFVAACDRDGRTRERAVAVAAGEADRLTLAALLIRCTDWVPQVQRAAQLALERRVRAGDGPALLALAGLVARLRESARFEPAWSELIAAEMCAAGLADARFALLGHADEATRALAFELVAKADPGRTIAAVRVAASDPSTRLARRAFTRARTLLEDSEWEALLRDTLAHRRAAIRGMALHELVALAPADIAELLRRSLFDPGRAVRDAAAWFLRNRHGVDPASEWRRELDEPVPRHACAALDALGMLATPLDAQRFRRFASHPVARVRAAAIRGLLRADAEGAPALAIATLHDASPRVVRESVLAYGVGAFFPPRALADAITAARDRRTLPILLKATHVLGQWETLEVLLPAAIAGIAPPALVESRLSRWQCEQNRRFAPLDTQRKERLLRLLDAMPDTVDAPLVASVRRRTEQA